MSKAASLLLTVKGNTHTVAFFLQPQVSVHDFFLIYLMLVYLCTALIHGTKEFQSNSIERYLKWYHITTTVASQHFMSTDLTWTTTQMPW